MEKFTILKEQSGEELILEQIIVLPVVLERFGNIFVEQTTLLVLKCTPAQILALMEYVLSQQPQPQLPLQIAHQILIVAINKYADQENA